MAQAHVMRKITTGCMGPLPLLVHFGLAQNNLLLHCAQHGKEIDILPLFPHPCYSGNRKYLANNVMAAP